MTYIPQDLIRPLKKTDDINLLTEDINRGLITSIENNRQKLVVGLSDGTRDIRVGSLSLVSQSGFSAYLTNNQTHSSSGNWIDLVCETEFFDNLSEYSTTSGIFTATKAGIYQANANVLFSGSLDINEIISLIISINNSLSTGGYIRGGYFTAFSTVTNQSWCFTSAGIVKLNAGDTLRVKAYQSSGGTMLLGGSDCNFSAWRLG